MHIYYAHSVNKILTITCMGISTRIFSPCFNICLCNFPPAHFHDLLLACTVFFSADPAFILTFATSFSKAIYVIIIIILCMKNCLATSAPDWGICCYCLINMKCSLAQSFLAGLKMLNLTDFLSVWFPPPSQLLDFRILIPPLFSLFIFPEYLMIFIIALWT